MIHHLDSIIAELRAAGHADKYIVYVIYDRTGMDREDIPSIMGMSQYNVNRSINEMRIDIDKESVIVERRWTACDDDYVRITKAKKELA